MYTDMERRTRRLNSLEVAGVVGSVALTTIVVVVAVAPHLAAAGVGGGLVGAGTRLLVSSFAGNSCSRS